MPHNLPKTRPVRRSFDLKVDLLERMKDASAATGQSLNSIAETAFENELRRLATEHNKGQPFPHRVESGRMAPRRTS
jgi:hypothetical protein